MFWKKDKGGAATTAAQSPKVKKATPRDLLMEELNAIEPGGEITYKLGPIYTKPFITVAHNTEGKKFTVYQDAIDQSGNPMGKRGKVWDANEAKDIATWIVEREGAVYQAQTSSAT